MIRSIRHFGITVRDLDRALSFYCHGLAFALDARFQRPREYIESLTNVSGTSLRIAIISKDGMVLELLEYSDRSDRPDSAAPVYHAGAAHICVEVESIEAARTSLARLGAKFLDDITTVPPGPGEGNRVVYGWDPEGIAFELVQVAEHG